MASPFPVPPPARPLAGEASLKPAIITSSPTESFATAPAHASIPTTSPLSDPAASASDADVATATSSPTTPSSSASSSPSPISSPPPFWLSGDAPGSPATVVSPRPPSSPHSPRRHHRPASSGKLQQVLSPLSPRHRHRRNASSDSGAPSEGGYGTITLRDNEADTDRGDACWARSVEVPDHVVVNGGPGLAVAGLGVGAFVSWNVRVETLSGSFMNIRKRYSEFDEFRSRLVRSFPGFDATIPMLPPKSVIAKFRPKFLEKRRAGLQYFLNCVVLNPEFAGSPVLKEFLFT